MKVAEAPSGDCLGKAWATPLAAQEAPLERLVDLCFNDLFRWELAKDAQLTPVARRLASAWPAET
ncbi:unnamed protein product [Effrenium voratum]|nr:unnamed protein product [Effrenium voratum]